MRLYLDTSALVKLHVDEEGYVVVRRAAAAAQTISTTAIAYVEARAAFARRRRERVLSAHDHPRVLRDLDADWQRYMVVAVTDRLIQESARLAEAHGLRAYDAVHLASALTVRDHLTEPLVFLCFDRRLERAARREGLHRLGAEARVRGAHGAR